MCLRALRVFVKSRPGLYRRVRGLVGRWRRWRYGVRQVHPTAYLAAGSLLSKDLVAREYSYVGPGCLVEAGVELGPYAMLGPRVSIVGADHRFDRPGVPIIFSGRPGNLDCSQLSARRDGVSQYWRSKAQTQSSIAE